MNFLIIAIVWILCGIITIWIIFADKSEDAKELIAIYENNKAGFIMAVITTGPVLLSGIIMEFLISRIEGR